nr:hypothetical protein [Tanacetum cinerariifolium]
MGVTSTKKYVELSAAKKIQADCDMKATNIILQGLPADIYSHMNPHIVAKDLWKRVQLLMQGETMQVDSQRLLNATTVKTEDLDTYDSDCDDVSNAKSVLMANISNDGFDVFSEVFKEQFDSIKKTHVCTKEHSDSLIDKLNLKSAENEDFKAQIQDKVFVITSLKNDLQKVKGKEVIDIVAQQPSANNIVPGMSQLDLDPLAPKLLQNKKAHIDYLKYTQEHADIL